MSLLYPEIPFMPFNLVPYVRPRPKSFVCDIAKLHEDDGTGLYDQSGVLALILPSDEGYNRLKKLNSFEHFSAAANNIPGASARLSSREGDLPADIIAANTEEIRQAKRERRTPGIVFAVVVEGTTPERLNREVLSLYDKTDWPTPPEVRL